MCKFWIYIVSSHVQKKTPPFVSYKIFFFFHWGVVKESRMFYHDFASTLGQIKSPKLVSDLYFLECFSWNSTQGGAQQTQVRPTPDGNAWCFGSRFLATSFGEMVAEVTSFLQPCVCCDLKGLLEVCSGFCLPPMWGSGKGAGALWSGQASLDRQLRAGILELAMTNEWNSLIEWTNGVWGWGGNHQSSRWTWCYCKSSGNLRLNWQDLGFRTMYSTQRYAIWFIKHPPHVNF